MRRRAVGVRSSESRWLECGESTVWRGASRDGYDHAAVLCGRSPDVLDVNVQLPAGVLYGP